MKVFYTQRGIYMFKDAVSIPDVSMQFVLRGAIARGASLWSPDKVAYDLLKAAVVGGPSVVFTRYHEAGVTKTRSHRGGEKLS